MRLSRLSNRQLRRLLREGEVRFAEDYEPRLTKVISGLKQSDRIMLPSIKALQGISHDLNYSKYNKESYDVAKTLSAIEKARMILTDTIFTLEQALKSLMK